MYKRREGGRMAVMGDYLYWDGGKVSKCVNNKCPSTGASSEALNGTLSVPLNRSWTNSTVVFRESPYPDGMPRSSWFALWPDTKSNTITRWGGERVGLKKNESVEQGDQTDMWAFTADGKGGGEWAVQKPSDGTKFQDGLARNFNALSAVCGRKGYFLGGTVTSQSNYDEENLDSDSKSASMPSGLLQYDLVDHKWDGNISSVEAFPETGNVKWGQGECLGDFLENPVVMFLGGATYGSNQKWTEVDFNTVTLYDPSAKKWHKQKTTAVTGSVPPSRYQFCTVGARGKNNTYDIFVYGGRPRSDDQDAYGDVWALSLPGFVWTLLTPSFKGAARWSHQCAMAGSSQMISMGGVSGWKSNFWKDDAWQQSLGVFDMVDLSWRDNFSVSGVEYDSPKVFRDWYLQGGQAAWDSDDVKALFATSNILNGNNTSSNNTNSDNSGEGTADSNGPNIPAIVGGAVGGIVFLALIAFAIWFLLSRKNKTHRHSRLTEVSDSEEGYNNSRHELDGSTLGAPSSAGLSMKFRDARYDTDGVHLRPPLSSRRLSLPNSWTWSWVPSMRPKIASPRAFPPSSPAELNGM